jgi:hypothetical protein
LILRLAQAASDFCQTERIGEISGKVSRVTREQMAEGFGKGQSTQKSDDRRILYSRTLDLNVRDVVSSMDEDLGGAACCRLMSFDIGSQWHGSRLDINSHGLECPAENDTATNHILCFSIQLT